MNLAFPSHHAVSFFPLCRATTVLYDYVYEYYSTVAPGMILQQYEYDLLLLFLLVLLDNKIYTDDVFVCVCFEGVSFRMFFYCP